MRAEDAGLYEYLPYFDRPKIAWPEGARLAFWCAPNIEHYELNPPLNPSHRFFFRNASISDAIEVPPQQLLLLLRT